MDLVFLPPSLFCALSSYTHTLTPTTARWNNGFRGSSKTTECRRQIIRGRMPLAGDLLLASFLRSRRKTSDSKIAIRERASCNIRLYVSVSAREKPPRHLGGVNGLSVLYLRAVRYRSINYWYSNEEDFATDLIQPGPTKLLCGRRKKV